MRFIVKGTAVLIVTFCSTVLWNRDAVALLNLAFHFNVICPQWYSIPSLKIISLCYFTSFMIWFVLFANKISLNYLKTGHVFQTRDKAQLASGITNYIVTHYRSHLFRNSFSLVFNSDWLAYTEKQPNGNSSQNVNICTLTKQSKSQHVVTVWMFWSVKSFNMFLHFYLS